MILVDDAQLLLHRATDPIHFEGGIKFHPDPWQAPGKMDMPMSQMSDGSDLSVSWPPPSMEITSLTQAIVILRAALDIFIGSQEDGIHIDVEWPHTKASVFHVVGRVPHAAKMRLYFDEETNLRAMLQIWPQDLFQLFQGMTNQGLDLSIPTPFPSRSHFSSISTLTM